MTTTKTLRAALYARVSTTDQTAENQLLELRRYAEARGWMSAEYVDTGVSGSKDRRPALDRLMADATARRVDLVVCWRLDRFGRNLRHLVVTIEELTAAGVGFVSLGESIDTGSPTGRLLLGVLGSFAQFERERIKERIQAGLQRARKQGQRLGRRRQKIDPEAILRVQGMSVRHAAKVLGVPASRVQAERTRLFGNPSRQPSSNAEDSVASVRQ
jgi:DNA invertase Pin-like site-specific DNA recombinase